MHSAQMSGSARGLERVFECIARPDAEPRAHASVPSDVEVMYSYQPCDSMICMLQRKQTFSSCILLSLCPAFLIFFRRRCLILPYAWEWTPLVANLSTMSNIDARL